MKKVLEYFKQLPTSEQEQFNKAMELFVQHNGNANTQRFYNRAGFSPKNLASLHYELKKLVGITEIDIINYQSAPVIEPNRLTALPMFFALRLEIATFLANSSFSNSELNQFSKLEISIFSVFN